MKKTLLLALALIAVGCGPGRPEGRDMAELARKFVPTTLVNRDGKELSASQYLDIETFEPYTGPIVRYDTKWCDGEGVVEFTGYLKNGFHHGKGYYYSCAGELTTEWTYFEGVEHGPYESYEIDGFDRQKGSYDMGDLCGDWVRLGQYESHPPCPLFTEGGN